MNTAFKSSTLKSKASYNTLFKCNFSFMRFGGMDCIIHYLHVSPVIVLWPIKDDVIKG
jgi:hypothetical protein